MTSTVLLCQFPETIATACAHWCQEELPGVNIRLLDCAKDLDAYLQLQPPFEQRDFPAPHMVMAHVEQGFPPHMEVIQRIKRFDQTKKIPILVFVPSDHSTLLQDLYQLPVSAVVPLSPETDPLAAIKDTMRYWVRVVQLPLV